METVGINNHGEVFSVTGQITHKESQLGIPDLTVLIYDQAQELTTYPSLPNSPIPAHFGPVASVK